MVRIKLYFKPGCWLCDGAEDLINGYREQYGIELTKINIEESEELYDLYRYDIPVIEFADGFTMHGRIKRKDFITALDGHKE